MHSIYINKMLSPLPCPSPFVNICKHSIDYSGFTTAVRFDQTDKNMSHGSRASWKVWPTVLNSQGGCIFLLFILAQESSMFFNPAPCLCASFCAAGGRSAGCRSSAIVQSFCHDPSGSPLFPDRGRRQSRRRPVAAAGRGVALRLPRVLRLLQRGYVVRAMIHGTTTILELVEKESQNGTFSFFLVLPLKSMNFALYCFQLWYAMNFT